MTADSTSLDVESTDHDQHGRSELDPLLGNESKVLTKQEARSARAQFLALCWALFVIGWFDGSTGPLLPRIPKFYDVNWPLFLLTIFSQCHDLILQVGFKTVSWIFVLGSTVSD